MKITIMTLFKEVVENMIDYSIMGRANKLGLIDVQAVDIRDFSKSKHKQVDDYPYGGGAGMVMMAEPIYDCYQSIIQQSDKAIVNQQNLEDLQDQKECQESQENQDQQENQKSQANQELHKDKKHRVIYVTPQGKPWSQALATEFSKEEELIILCGHYEGVDQRVIDEIVTDEISIGDYVLTGGELPALVITDSIIRLIPGVLGKEESFQEESFTDSLLEYPQYTRPRVFKDREVPEVLLSGDHAKIRAYRREEALINTLKKRPDLLELAELTGKEKMFVETCRKTHCK